MQLRAQAFLLFFFFLFGIFWVGNYHVFAQSPTADPQTADQQQKIKELEDKLKEVQGQAKTLSSQIAVMDNQIRLTELRIQATTKDIEKLDTDIEVTTKQITKLEETLNITTKALLNRIVATYQLGSSHPLEVVLSSGSVSDMFTRLNYMRLVQLHDKKLIYETQQAKTDYTNQKEIFEGKKEKIEKLKNQLLSYTKQLDNEKKNKKQLLAETEGSESNYQRLLAQARAQLAAFGRFTASQGGASILSNQTVCDDWGCYYNQRDSQWGGNPLNNTQFTLASDGCLVTAMAMVYTHYGYKNVTPKTINSNSGNFASYYPAYLKFAITADGVSSNRVRDSIDSMLSSGHPVVAGVSYDGGPISDHFVVLVSGSNGNYTMNDPFTPNGRNIPFSSHYAIGGIREVYKVSF